MEDVFGAQSREFQVVFVGSLFVGVTCDENLLIRMIRRVFVHRAQCRKSGNAVFVRRVDVALAAIAKIRHHYSAVEVEVYVFDIEHQATKWMQDENVRLGGDPLEHLFGVARIDDRSILLFIRHELELEV